MLYLKTPGQPDSLGCGVCVLIMIALMATEGVEAFYLLNEQCEYRRAGGPQPEGATEVFRREVQWKTRYISTTDCKRIGNACLRPCSGHP